jgi:hypothetical protein
MRAKMADNSLEASSEDNNNEPGKIVMNLGYNIIASTQSRFEKILKPEIAMPTMLSSTNKNLNQIANEPAKKSFLY